MKFLHVAIFCCVFTATMHPEENTKEVNSTPITVESNENNAGLQLIQDTQEALLEITQRVIDRDYTDDSDEYDREFYGENVYLLNCAFQDFYEYIIHTKPKPRIHAFILFFEFCKPIFKHGALAKLIAQQDDDIKNLIFLNFVMTWQALFEEELDIMTDDFETIILGDCKSCDCSNTSDDIS